MKKIILAVVLALGAPLAHADLLLEPYVGYFMGKSDDGTTKTDFDGMAFGGRVGYQNLGFMVGADYMTGKWTDDDDPSNDITPSMLGVFAGYNFPILLRVYGVYGITTKSKVESSGSSFELEGSSIRLGVGTTILPLVSVNLEYMTSSFDEFDGQALTPEVKQTAYALTVSLPFTL